MAKTLLKPFAQRFSAKRDSCVKRSVGVPHGKRCDALAIRRAVIRLMIYILRCLNDPTLWEFWYIPYDG